MVRFESIVLPTPKRFLAFLEVGPVGVFAWFPDGVVKRVSPPDGNFMQGSISPSGAAVVFPGCERGKIGLWITDLRELIPRRVTSPDFAACQPAYSHDGAFIVFSSDQHASGPRYQYDDDGFVRAFPILQEGEQAHIYITDSQVQNPRQVTEGPWCDRRPTLSPDNSRIAFSSNRSGRWELWTTAVNGSSEPERLLPGVEGSRPWWSIDGKSLFFQLMDGKGHQIFVLDLDDRTYRRVEQNRSTGFTRGAFATLDGRYILAHSNRNGYASAIRISLDGRKIQEIMPPGFSESGHVTEATNGVRVFDSRNRPGTIQ